MAPISAEPKIRLAFPTMENPPPTKLSYNIPFTDSCVDHISSLGTSRAYVLASGSLSKQTSYLRDLENALGSKHAGTWIGLRQHTYWTDLLPIMADMRSKNADVLVTLGGSSLADGAKAIVYFLANNIHDEGSLNNELQQTEDDKKRKDGVLQRDGVGKPADIPLIFIPTSLSGGEYSKYAGGTNSVTHQKDQLSHPTMYASLVILDPKLTLSCPETVWLGSGVRAIDHCCESSVSINGIPEVDNASAEGLKLLIPGLIETKKDPKDLEARLKTMLGANLAMTALANGVMKGASHGIGHQLGPLGVAHGHTSCILLPAVMKYNAAHESRARNDVSEQQAKVKALLWGKDIVGTLEGVGLSPENTDVGDALRAVFNLLGMPSTLKDVGVQEDKFDDLAKNSLNDGFVMCNPVPLGKEEVLEILKMVAE